MNDSQSSQETENSLRKVESIAELVALLVKKIDPGNDDPRQHRDKIRQRVKYGLHIEDADLLAALGAPTNWLIDVELVSAWARKKWPKADFGAARIALNPVVGPLYFGDKPTPWHIPGDLLKCQKLLEESYAMTRQMRDVIQSQEREILRLRPLAERYEHICAMSKASAQKPRNV